MVFRTGLGALRNLTVMFVGGGWILCDLIEILESSEATQ